MAMYWEALIIMLGIFKKGLPVNYLAETLLVLRTSRFQYVIMDHSKSYAIICLICIYGHSFLTNSHHVNLDCSIIVAVAA